MARVLVVDDEQSIRITVSEFIKEDGHEVSLADDAAEALSLLREDPFDVVVTDIILPRKSGVALLGDIREVDPDVQVIMITGEPEIESAAEAVRKGAFDYLAKPISREDITRTVSAAAEKKALLDKNRRLEEENRRHREHLEELVEQRTAQLRDSEVRYRTLFSSIADPVFVFDEEASRFLDCNRSAVDRYGYTMEELRAMTPRDLHPPEEREHVNANIADTEDFSPHQYMHITKDGEQFPVEVHTTDLEYQGRRAWISIVRDITVRRRAQEALQKSLNGTIQAIGQTTEMRDPYTAGHQRRVTLLASAIAREMGLSEEQVEGIRVAGLMHDIGKMSVPAEILSKPSRLTEIEFGLIKAHPQVAYDILQTVEFPWPAAQIVLQHHERMDGSGYPQGLKAEEIMIEARILSVADVVEAMASHRPYRPALGIDKALEEITQNKGALYDSEVVDACLRLFTEEGFEFQE